MDYLKKYLNEEDYQELLTQLDEDYQILFITSEQNVEKVIEYFRNQEFNIKDLLFYKPNLFFEEIDFLKEKLEQYQKLIPLLREETSNFDLIGL